MRRYAARFDNAIYVWIADPPFRPAPLPPSTPHWESSQKTSWRPFRFSLEMQSMKWNKYASKCMLHIHVHTVEMPTVCWTDKLNNPNFKCNCIANLWLENATRKSPANGKWQMGNAKWEMENGNGNAAKDKIYALYSLVLMSLMPPDRRLGQRGV